MIKVDLPARFIYHKAPYISMWLAKVSLFDPDCIFAVRNKKFGLQSYEHTLTHYQKKGRYYFMSSHILVGNIKAKQDYIASLRKDKRVKNLDVNGDVTVELIEKKASDIDLSVYKAFYDPEIIFPKPGLVDCDGWEYYEFASWNRSAINKVITAVKSNFDGQLLSLKDTDEYELYMPRVLPMLSPKQKEAVSLAVKEGYYEFPRRIRLEELAEISGSSFSTFREHLRIAERKLLPLMYRTLYSGKK